MKKSHRPGGLIASLEKEDAKLELQLSLGLPIIRSILPIAIGLMPA